MSNPKVTVAAGGKTVTIARAWVQGPAGPSGGGGGSGTVTSASVVTANGVSATVANATTTPAFTFTLGAITPSTVRGLTITTTTGTFTLTNAKTFAVTNSLTLAGTDGSTLNVGAGGTLGTAAFTAATAYEVVGAAAAAQAASQPLDSDLTAIAALTTTSFGRGVLTWANAAAGRTDLGLGTLATQSGTFSGTSSGTNTGDQDLSTLLVKASNLSDLTNAATARTNLGLGTLATLSTVTLTSNVTGTLPVANGGTGLTALGSALQVLRTNASGTALEYATLSGGGNAQTADPLSQFASTTSAQLRGVISDANGTGALLFAGGNIGAATATSVNGLTISTTTGTFTLTNAKTLSVSNTLTFAGTDGSGLNIGTGGTLGTLAYQSGTFTGAGIEALLDARYGSQGWREHFFTGEGTPGVSGTDILNSYFFSKDDGKLYIRGAASWDLEYDFSTLTSVETTWRTGTTAPDNGTGIDGDWYNNTDTGVVYRREGGSYVGRGGLLGATAAQGSLADGAAQKSANLSDLASASTARANLELGTLATQSGTFSGTSSGTNTGDQSLTGHVTSTGNTAVLGSFTLAELNTAVSDANVARTSGTNTFTGTQTFNGNLSFPDTIRLYFNGADAEFYYASDIHGAGRDALILSTQDTLVISAGANNVKSGYVQMGTSAGTYEYFLFQHNGTASVGTQTPGSKKLVFASYYWNGGVGTNYRAMSMRHKNSITGVGTMDFYANETVGTTTGETDAGTHIFSIREGEGAYFPTGYGVTFQDGSTIRTSGGRIQFTGVNAPTISSTDTLTNKRIAPRIVTTTDDATAVIDVAATDVYELSAVANATTFSTTGTALDGQPLLIRFKDAGVAKALTWDAVFAAIGVTLPTTTVAGKWHYVGCRYNSTSAKFDVLAAAVQA